jgi:glutathione S-transferase
MLTIYGRKSSFNVQKVMWLVGELAIAHRHIELGGAFGGLDTPEFRAMNPHGRVPVIVDGATTVWESRISRRGIIVPLTGSTPPRRNYVKF